MNVHQVPVFQVFLSEKNDFCRDVDIGFIHRPTPLPRNPSFPVLHRAPQTLQRFTACVLVISCHSKCITWWTCTNWCKSLVYICLVICTTVNLFARVTTNYCITTWHQVSMAYWSNDVWDTQYLWFGVRDQLNRICNVMPVLMKITLSVPFVLVMSHE